MSKKCLWTMNIGGYAPEITRLTYPWLKRYATKVKADFRIITERKWPELPLMHEKLQLYTLGREYDWNIYVDSDCLIHPDFMDITELLTPDTIVHYGFDFAPNRFRSDEYFRRDGRAIGSCGWFSVASRDCLDLWHPLEDMTVEEMKASIYPTTNERWVNMEPLHLTDDYLVSRNIARYGLKAMTVRQVLEKYGHGKEEYLWHEYTITKPQKVEHCIKMLYAWGLGKEAGLPELPAPINIANAEKIEGWMEKPELEWLAVQARCHNRIAEIGSWMGRSARALGDNTKGTVTSIDPWNGALEKSLNITTFPPDHVCRAYQRNLADLIESGKVKFHRETANEAFLRYGPESFDMVFIDGAHDYPSVKDDIENWSKVLAPGGLLCGHDFSPMNPEVMQAVNDLVPGFEVIPNGKIWYKQMDGIPLR